MVFHRAVGPRPDTAGKMQILTFVLYTLSICIGTLTSSSVFPNCPIIIADELTSRVDAKSVFRKFWIYGNVNVHSSTTSTYKVYQEASTDAIILISRQKFSFDSPKISVSADRMKKLEFSSMPEKYGLVAFDDHGNAYHDLNSLQVLSSSLSNICFIYSGTPETLDILRLEAANLITGHLIPNFLASGSMMACVQVSSSGISRKASERETELPKLIFLPSWNLVNATARWGLVLRDLGTGTYFGSVFAFGSIHNEGIFQGKLVELNDGHNKVTITSSSICMESPKATIVLDSRSSLCFVQRPLGLRLNFSFFVMNSRGKIMSEFQSHFKAAYQSNLCFAFSPDFQILSLLRNRAYSFLNGKYPITVLPSGSLLVCVQAIAARTYSQHAPDIVSSPAISANPIRYRSNEYNCKRKAVELPEAIESKYVKKTETVDACNSSNIFEELNFRHQASLEVEKILRELMDV